MIFLKDNKKPQKNSYTQKAPLPKTAVVPLSQHIGRPAKPIVEKNSLVEENQIIAKADGLISSNIHSPVKGKVKDIKEFNHPILKHSPAVIIETDTKQEAYSSETAAKDPSQVLSLPSEKLIEAIRQAGIVGMGGATFPTAVKLTPPKKIDTLIVNGAECEPFLTCDFRIMIEHTESIIRGIEIITKILQPERVIIAVEENKKEAIKRFNSKLHTKKYSLPKAEVIVLASAYPQGAEKQLIYNTLKRKTPAGKLPFEVGAVVQNVGTCFAIYQALYLNKPLTERVVTFAGDALTEPKNLLVKTGTLVSELFSQGILEFKKGPAKVIFGGPMMGIAVPSLDFPILKGTSGVLFFTQSAIDPAPEQTCIRCGRCVDVCPMNLLPLMFAKHGKTQDKEALKDYFIEDCIECGSCAYACPAKIPLVNYIKLGKELIRKK